MKPLSYTFVRRTFERMNMIADHVPAEALTAYLVRKGIPKGWPWGLAVYLDDVQQCMPDEPYPVCAVCGRDLDKFASDGHRNRADRRFCSARCRQRAYRMRVADNPSGDTPTVTKQRIRDASDSS